MDQTAQPAWASDPKVYAEVVAFAEYLGFDTKEHPDLLWIAEQARSAPLPEPWFVARAAAPADNLSQLETIVVY